MKKRHGNGGGGGGGGQYQRNAPDPGFGGGQHHKKRGNQDNQNKKNRKKDGNKKKSLSRKESKQVQEKIKALMVNPKELLNFYNENFAEKIMKLSFHTYGNFIVQKFLETQNMFIFADILNRIKDKAVDLSNNKYACRIIQLVRYPVIDRTSTNSMP